MVDGAKLQIPIEEDWFERPLVPQRPQTIVLSFDLQHYKRKAISFVGVWTHDLPHPRSRALDGSALNRSTTATDQLDPFFAYSSRDQGGILSLQNECICFISTSRQVRTN